MSQEGILKNFEKGLLSEKRAMSLCQELLLLVEGEEEKDDLKEIIADEARHIKITNDLIEIFKNNYIS